MFQGMIAENVLQLFNIRYPVGTEFDFTDYASGQPIRRKGIIRHAAMMHQALPCFWIEYSLDPICIWKIEPNGE